MKGESIEDEIRRMQECTKRVCHAISNMARTKEVCLEARISVKDYERWRDLGERGIAPYDKFYEETERALADAVVTAKAYIKQAAKKDWRAAEAFLHIKRKEELHELQLRREQAQIDLARKRIEVMSGLKRLGATGMTDEQLKQMLEALNSPPSVN